MATLITLQDYKAYAGISNSNSDAKLTITLDLVEEFVETYCGRKFLSGTYTEQLSSEASTLFPRNLPITSVTGLSYIDTSKVSQSIDAADYIVYSEEGIVEIFDHNALSVASILRPFSITYVGGFTSTPAALKLALMDLVTYYDKQQYINKTTSVNVNVLGQDDESEGSELPPHIKRVLDLYRVL